MSTKCNVCSLGFANNAYRVSCAACEKVMHIKCVNVSKDDYFFLKNEGKSWYCGPCAKERRKSRLLTPLQTSQSSEEQTPGQGTQKQPYETLLEIIEEIREDINKSNSAVSKDIDNLRSEVKDLTDNLNKYADIINENTTALGEIKTSIDTLANKFDDLKVEVTKCQSDIEEMKTKSNELEQQTRENIIEIVGVPSSPNEDLIDIMKKIGVGMNVVVKDEMAFIVAFLILVCRSTALPCAFNPMCSCKMAPPGHDNKTSIRDVSCAGVPFSRLPDFPGSKISHIDVVGSGLEVVEPDSVASTELLSVRFISNSIALFSHKALQSAVKVLRSLDLSYNRIQEIPFDAITKLSSLEWLNLHSNSLWSLQGNWGGAANTITNLFLGENHVSSLKGLEKFKILNLLNLDKNQLHDLAPGYLPKTLHTLSLSGNLFSKFPWEYLSSAERIAWLYLRDNFINTLPLYNFKNRKKLDKLDLGDNAFKEMRPVFNGTLQIRDLNLDLNEFRTIGDDVFRGTNVGRIYLSQNRIENVSEGAFNGVHNTLEYLDLGGNHLQMIPRAVESLRALKYLYLPSNNISFIHNDTFLGFSETLSAMSLSGNQLEEVPSEALCVCRRLTHLNLGYNHIIEIQEENFVGLDSLETLLLMNNRIVILPAHTFRQTPNLRELSLSFNKISAIDEDAFVDLESSLESLEISFGLYFEVFPEEYLKPLKSLVWLALDNNDFRSIAKEALYPFRNLQYLNLEGNRIPRLPMGLFHPLVHGDLKDIRLSYNHLTSVEPHTFSSLQRLQSIVLSGNQIKIIKPNAFRSLPSKLSVILSDNKIDTIAPRAFHDIATLVRLDLQSNKLQDFSLSAFQNVTDPNMPMALNLSRNHIITLRVADTRRAVCIYVIDLTRNNMYFVPKEFFEAINHNLLKINLGYNNINKLDEAAFGEQPHLETLSVPHNAIVTVRKRAFAGMYKLQILDLSRNHIAQLHMEQFNMLPNLRILDLSYNHLRSIQANTFDKTKLERLNLANNELLAIPYQALAEVGFTLRVLDISHNKVERLLKFTDTSQLISLNLGYNKLANLDEDVFKNLTNLIRLELSGNTIRGNLRKMLDFSKELRYLNLGEMGLSSLNPPDFPVFSRLVSLNLSANYLSSVAFLSVSSLRELYIANCRLPSLPSWVKLPHLKHLDISYNPIRILSKESFKGLNGLESLDITGLDSLDRLDLDTLTPLGALRSIKLQTWPQLISEGVGALVSRVPTVRRLSVTVTEPRLLHLGVLDNRKLRHIEITGLNLKRLSPNALHGLRPMSELVLQIRGTSIEELPLGLFSNLKVRHLSLDLRNNRLVSLSPDFVYYNMSTWENSGTKLISGCRRATNKDMCI
ncbi:hypothetical protein GE061_009488 [Apolygus lucorum]|uniref:PHD-type domain-containing protein n=1 Tax=Apolygus lucorum TaxID=248454 RepID=A0A8S9Y4G4_APOLU|nr:hypothetical protein GE061_009488 [Apolygus lucorum]